MRSCPDCESDQVADTSCNAAGCPAERCVDCGWGCDLEYDGQCRRELDAEGSEAAGARLDQERAAWGLAPLHGEAGTTS